MKPVRRLFTFRDRRSVALGLCLMVLWVGLTALAIQRFAGLAADDFFVTFRYAANLAQGHGFVFNPGERTLGLTNPGLGLLLAALSLLTGLAIPYLGTLVFALALLGLALLLFREGQRQGTGLEAALGGTLILASTYIWICHGGSAPLVLLLLAAAAALLPRVPGTAGILAGLAVWCRPDAAVGVVLLAGLRWLEKRKLPATYAMTASAAIGLGALWSYQYFGSVLPITLESKRLLAELQGHGHSGLGFWSTALPLWQRHGGILAAEIAAAGLAGQYFVLRYGSRSQRLISLHGLSLAVAYPLLGVPFFNWYTVPTAVALLYGAAYFAIRCGKALGKWIGDARGGPWIGRRQDGPRVGVAVSAALVGLMLFSFGERNLSIYRSFSWHHRMELYRDAADWIRENSDPAAEITAIEIGVLGYYSERPLQDLLGMVTPRALPFLAVGNLRGVFQSHPTEFLVRYGGGGRYGGMFRSRWFRRKYFLAHTVQGREEGRSVRIYRLRSRPKELPGPRGPHLSPGEKSLTEGGSLLPSLAPGRQQ